VVMQDWGLFGPDSVTWRIHADPSMMAGGIRALLIQALNPLAMGAVAQSNIFQTDPWGQLLRTADYVVVTTFGDTDTAQAAGARVRAKHRRVRGVDEVTGAPYSADDPDLLLWVHCAEVDSFLAAYRHFAGGLSDADADRYVTEMVRAAELVGLSPDGVPRTAAAVRAYIDEAKNVCVTPAARAGFKFLLNPPMPLPRRIVWSVGVAAAISILPAKLRDLYGIPWFDPAGRAVTLAAGPFYRALNVMSPRPAMVREAFTQWATERESA
jgi:uncharacterized protein (DUF2236 family)